MIASGFSNSLKTSTGFLIFTSINSTDVEQSEMDLPWSRLKDLFLRHDYRKNKDGLNFWPVELKAREDWVLSEPKEGNAKPSYRTKDNVSAVTFIVMDLDNPGCKEKVQANFSDVEHILYSTHSYNENQPHKYRLIMPLEKPIPADEWREKFSLVRAMVDGDRSCVNLSRQYFFPSHSTEAGIDPYVHHNIGEILNSEMIDQIARKAMQEDHDLRNELSRSSKPNIKRHHLNGEVIKPMHNGGLDYTFAGLSKRHARVVEDLTISNGRHDFAQRVIYREIIRNQAQTDFESMIKFLFRTSQEKSSKALYQGNTMAEIPELISSSISKTPSPASIYEAHGGSTEFYAYIDNCINYAMQVSMKTYRQPVTDHYERAWEFPEKAQLSSKEMEANPYSAEAFKARHHESIAALRSDRDIQKFVANVIQHEADYDHINYNDTLNLLSKSLSEWNVINTFTVISQGIESSSLNDEVRKKFDLMNKIQEKAQEISPSPGP